MPEKKCLKLTIHKKWFDMIKSGEKKIEYREIKDYWKKRLFSGNNPKVFDEVHFRNGYRKDSPLMRVEFKGIRIEKKGSTDEFAIMLGDIIEAV